MVMSGNGTVRMQGLVSTDDQSGAPAQRRDQCKRAAPAAALCAGRARAIPSDAGILHQTGCSGRHVAHRGWRSFTVPVSCPTEPEAGACS